MNIFSRCKQSRIANLHLPAVLLVSMLGVSLALHADEYQDASQLFKQGQQTAALSKLNNFLSGKPKDAQGRFLKGLIFTEQGNTADAIKVFSELTRDYPELPEPYNNLAVLYAGQGQYDKAKSSLEMAIRTHPSYATAHENLGDIYAKMASQAYDRALQLDSNNSTTKTKLAMIQDLFSDNPRDKLTGHRSPVLPARPQPAAQTAAIAKPVAAPIAIPLTKPVAETVAKPVAKPAAAPVEIAVVKEVSAHSAAERSVREAVENWAQAWASKDVKKYLSYYAADFKTPDGDSHKAWAETRKERINRPKHIEVKVGNFKINFEDSSHAIVKFRQDYRASNFKASGGKTMLMVKSGGNWYIQEERTR